MYQTVLLYPETEPGNPPLAFPKHGHYISAMPVTLYHGPASPQKNNHLLNLIGTHRNDEPIKNHFRVITSSPAHVTLYKEEILNSVDQKLILGKAILTWDDFLLNILKFNEPRVHLADRELSYYLIFLLLMKNHSHVLNENKFYLKTIQEFYTFFLQVKTCGLDVTETERLFRDHIGSPFLFDLFQSYQVALREHHYYDPGDLTLNVLKQLRTQTLKLPKDITDIYFAKIYPLRPGQREIIRKLKSCFPKLGIHIFYDEVFSQENHVLQKAYEDLGEISDETKYIEAATGQAQLMEYKNPYQEVDAVVGDIRERLQNGWSVNQVAIGIASDSYLPYLVQRLHEEGICFATPFFQRVTDEKYEIKDLVTQWLATENQFLIHKIQSQITFHDFSQSIRFADSVFEDLSKTIPQEMKENYVNQRMPELPLPLSSLSEQLVITDPEHLSAYTKRKIYFLGYCLESILQTSESSLYSPHLSTQTDFLELLQAPRYRLKVALDQIKQLTNLNPDLILTKPEFDFKNRPTTNIETPTHRHLDTNNKQRDKIAAQQHTDYFKTKKKNFSVSELQEYLNCPYRYYASYHLKLDKFEVSELEPASDIKGSFVHRVLQRLLTENKTEYLEGLEYESYRKRLIDKLGPIIQEELKQNDGINGYNHNIVEFYGNRVYQTIMALIEIEAKNFKSGLKKTTPKHFEWPFGKGNPEALFFNMESGPIHLTGRVDRVDVNHSHKNFAVVDYKTGDAPKSIEIKNAQSIQLPLYLMAVQNSLYAKYTATGGYYYSLKENTINGFTVEGSADEELLGKQSRISEQDWKLLQEAVLNQAMKVVEEIQKGNFDPKPYDPKICRYCDYKRICGYNEPNS